MLIFATIRRRALSQLICTGPPVSMISVAALASTAVLMTSPTSATVRLYRGSLARSILRGWRLSFRRGGLGRRWSRLMKYWFRGSGEFLDFLQKTWVNRNAETLGLLKIL